MNNKFDELTKGLAQSTTRRAALRQFGRGFAGAVLAMLGFANAAQARNIPKGCICDAQYFGCRPNDMKCIRNCAYRCS